MCVNTTAKTHKTLSVNDACRELKKLGTCSHFKNQQDINQHSQFIAKYSKSAVGHNLATLDIEELADLGKKHEFCPYFLSQGFVKTPTGGRGTAKVIVCPYQYLIDPAVRQQFDITNDIIIIDEAHNIEGQCREANSLSISKDQLETCYANVEKTCDFYENACNSTSFIMPPEYIKLHDALNSLKKILQSLGNFMTEKWETRNQSLIHDSFRKTEYYQAYETKPQLSKFLTDIGVGDRNQLENMAKMLTDIYEAGSSEESEDKKKKDTSQNIVPGSATKMMVERLIMVCRHVLNQEDPEHDFRGLIKFSAKTEARMTGDHVSLDTFEMQIICMNPGIAFKAIREKARSVILCSGTLSPTASFEHELETKFSVAICPHVIDKNQIGFKIKKLLTGYINF